jgi:hypothetical protein
MKYAGVGKLNKLFYPSFFCTIKNLSGWSYGIGANTDMCMAHIFYMSINTFCYKIS